MRTRAVGTPAVAADVNVRKIILTPITSENSRIQHEGVLALIAQPYSLDGQKRVKAVFAAGEV